MSKPPKPIQRRDATGHLDPAYARDLLEKARETKNGDADEPAFLAHAHSSEELAEELGESFVATVTSGEEQGLERHDRITPDESGGPFVPSTAAQEFAEGTDASNIAEATREPLPRTSKADP